MGVIINILGILGFIGLIYVGPIIMNFGFLKLTYLGQDISKKDKVYMFIPLLNNIVGSIRYNGRVSLFSISSILVVISLISRIVVMFWFYSNVTLQTITIVSLLVVLVLFWVTSIIQVNRVLSESGVYTTGEIILNSILILPAMLMIGIYLPKKMEYFSKKSGNGF